MVNLHPAKGGDPPALFATVFSDAVTMLTDRASMSMLLRALPERVPAETLLALLSDHVGKEKQRLRHRNQKAQAKLPVWAGSLELGSKRPGSAADAAGRVVTYV